MGSDVLKVELHTHTADDRFDRISYTGQQLVDRAAALGYDALAITLHDQQLDLASLRPYADERGIVLIPGVEKTIEGKHVLLLNFDPAAERVDSFEALAKLRRDQNGIVVAPHPFFPAPSCLRGLMHRDADLFDAVEYNGMFTRRVNFNGPAVAWAHRHGKPVVGNCDVHRLRQLGSTYSLVDADRSADAICDAIRHGRVRIEARPLTMMAAATIIADLFIGDLFPRLPGNTTAARLRAGA